MTNSGSTSAVDIEAALYQTLADARGVAVHEVQHDIGGDGAIDSLEGVELVAAAEELFGITIDDDEITSATCSSVPRLATLVRRKIDAVDAQ